MARKPLGKDKFGVQKVMRLKDYFGDSLGQLALNAVSTMVGQLTYFYTDKVGMAAGAIATMFMINKIIDAFTDLIMGNIVDHTKPGKEKYRPWLLKAGIPMGIMMVLIFTVPNTTGAGQMAYAFITNLLITSIFYTAVCIPYQSLQTVRTNSQEERGVMGTWRAAAGYVSGFVMAILIIPITNVLGGNQSAWIKFGAIVGLVVILALLIAYLTSRETPTESGTAVEKTEEDEDPVPFKEAIIKLLHNKYWVIVLIVNLISCILYGTTSASGTYYCKWIFGNDNLVAMMGAVGLIPTFLGFALVGSMIKKLGVVKTLKVSFAIGAIAEIIMLIFRENLMVYTVLGCASTFATIPMMCLVGVLTTMSIDYNEYKYGVKMVACSNSASSFGGKIGSGIGASVIGWTLGIVGYDASLSVAPASTIFSLIMPLIMFVVMYILVSMFDLEKKLPAMREEVAQRKAGGKH